MTTCANLAWLAACTPAAIAFARALKDPQGAQDQILQHYLQAAANTAFGRAHHLSEVRTYDQFQRRVPIRNYDEMRPWIERIQRGEIEVLTRGKIHRLLPTSGSTAARKLIPYTGASRREFNRAIAPWIFDLYRRSPRAIGGCAYWSVTPLARGAFDEMNSAVPIGFDEDSEYLGRRFHRIVNAVLAVPGNLREISSIEALRYVTMLLLLRRRDLALISVWHPSFLELLLDTLRDDFGQLTTDVEHGTCARADDIPAELKECVVSRPDPRRAREISLAGAQNPGKLWPKLCIISCWADGHAASSAAALSARMPDITMQPKGLLATEAIVSIPFAGRHPLAIRSHFFEFLDDGGKVRTAAELEIGQTYNVIVTTASGLWRYRLDDLVRVTGRVGSTPSLRFAGKAGLVSDRRGEKLSDGFVASLLARLFESHPPRPSFTLLAPDCENGAVRYVLYMNATPFAGIDESLERLLCENPHYAYCRQLGQLRPPRATYIRSDAYGAYCARLMQQGERLGDIKPAALSPLDGWSELFECFVEN